MTEVHWCLLMLVALGCLCAPAHAQAPAAPALEGAQPHAVAPVPEMVVDDRGRPYLIYVEAMPGESWDEKIRNAVNRALDAWSGAEIILPGRSIEITQPIRLWRQRKIDNDNIDTLADGVELAYLGNCYTAIKGGTPADLPRGITLRGTSRGATNLVWKGGPNQVVIDLPAPWYCKVSDLSIDGENTEGLIGIRYRAGWEFGRNGGKHNRFEDITITRLDVAFDVGGPFLPDLVDGLFQMIRVEAARIAFRVVGANVAEMWFREISIGNVEEAGFKLGGYSGRLVRSIKEKDTPTTETVLTDMDGREIFIEQIEHVTELVKQQVQTRPHPDVPGSERRRWIGGGASSCVISNVEAHMHDPRAWLIDSWYAPVRLENVRMEGCSPVLRAGPRGALNGRFNDILIDVNSISIGGVAGRAIEYDRRNTLVLIGGTFEGPIGLGQDASCHALGVTFKSEAGQPGESGDWFKGGLRNGVIPKGAELPEDSFFTRTGNTAPVPYRRGWPGEVVTSGPGKEPRFVQLQGTSGARIYRMPEAAPPEPESRAAGFPNPKPQPQARYGNKD